MEARGFDVAGSPREVAGKTAIILLFLPGPIEVAETIEGPEGLMAGSLAGTVIVDLSTVDPESTRRVADLVTEAGGEYLDAPVLGRPDRAGNWTLPTGGSERALSKVRHVLERLSSRIIHVGPSGSGNVIKLLNNLMFGAINNVTAEVLSAATRLGVSPKVVYETIAESGAATVSNLFKSIGPKIVDGDFTPVFRVELLYKDMDLGLKMAKTAGATMVVSEGAQKLTEMALAKGYQGQDSSVVTRISDLISRDTDEGTELKQ
jgi:3-hydroxyisobutyrate dehydrogenase-like beta-hydroxyacid dehydrogenase